MQINKVFFIDNHRQLETPVGNIGKKSLKRSFHTSFFFLFNCDFFFTYVLLKYCKQIVVKMRRNTLKILFKRMIRLKTRKMLNAKSYQYVSIIILFFDDDCMCHKLPATIFQNLIYSRSFYLYLIHCALKQKI